MSNKHIVGLLLAGGEGGRLEPDKCWKVVAGMPMISRVAAALTAVTHETIMVGGQRPPAGVRAVPDQNPGGGPSWAIYTGMKAVPADTYLVLASDMPFVTDRLLDHLLLTSPGFDVVLPIVGGRVQPLCAAYSHTCRSPLAQALEGGGTRVVDFFSNVRVRRVLEAEVAQFGPPEVLFFNVNTLEELDQARQIALQVAARDVLADNLPGGADG